MKKSKKGFTLIELIVVIAVLALLAAVAVPMISGWVDKAKQGEAKANARTIELALKAYLADPEVDTQNGITSGNLSDALGKFGLGTEIEGSSAKYEVTSNGSVEWKIQSASAGSIVMKP